MRNTKGFLIPLCLLFVSFALFGCLQKNAEVQGSLVLASAKNPIRKGADHQVVVMLGSEYAVREGILAPVIAEYGLAGSDGKAVILRYPESFTENKRVSFSALSAAASMPKTTVIVTIGAPEGTARELAKIRKNHEKINIITLFSFDESISIEAVSSLVIDSPISDDVPENESPVTLSDADVGILLLASVLFGESSDGEKTPLLRLTESLEGARKLVRLKKTDANWKLSSFIDTGTNLRSWNHVSFERMSGISE